jgi:hypothetical protein
MGQNATVAGAMREPAGGPERLFRLRENGTDVLT